MFLPTKERRRRAWRYYRAYRHVQEGTNYLAEFNGIREPHSSLHRSCIAVKQRGVSQPCIGAHSRVKARSNGVFRVRHYTYKRCEMTDELMCQCYVNVNEGQGRLKRVWRLDGIHPVGKCPHCEYYDTSSRAGPRWVKQLPKRRQ